MITMGVDASTTSTGWCIFEDSKLVEYGCIKPQASEWRERLMQQAPELKVIVEKYHPQQVIIEDVPLKAANPKTLVILGAVQGFLYGVFSSFEIPMYFLLPSEWRSVFNLFDGTREGTKRPELKRKSIEKANELFGLELRWVSPSSKFNDDDISDAILIAYSQLKGRKIAKHPKS